MEEWGAALLVAWRKRGKGKAGTVGAAAVWLAVAERSSCYGWVSGEEEGNGATTGGVSEEKRMEVWLAGEGEKGERVVGGWSPERG